MSKSAGNSVSPLELIDKMGSDVLRLWVMSVDYRSDARVSDEIISHVVDTYRSLRNTIRFQIGNLSDFDRDRDALPVASCLPLDQWALHRTAELIAAVTEAYEQYEFQRAYQIINRFCTVTLSATYHDILKDRLYTLGRNSMERRSAQTAIDQIFDTLIRLVAPVLMFTADEAFLFAHGETDNSESSIHLQTWPDVPVAWNNPEIASSIEALFGFRNQVNDKLEVLRQEKSIGQSLEVSVTFSADPTSEDFKTLREYEAYLPELFIVSSVSLLPTPGANEAVSVAVAKIEGERCPRCWRWLQALEEYQEDAKLCARCRIAMEE